MRAVWYEQKGPAAKVLRVGLMEQPRPGPGEVLVKVRASGVNPTDVKLRAGSRGRVQMPYPRIVPHHDGAGIIVDVGPEVDRARLGERVWFYEAQLNRPFGSAAEFVTLPSSQAVELPEGVSFVEGACLGVPAMTGHRCVFADGPVSGQTILVTGGAGSVGFYAIQMARLGGAEVIATVGSPEQAEVAAAAGANRVINRHEEDIEQLIASQSVDRIVEVAFGANLKTSLHALRTGGVIATYASDAIGEPTVPFWTFVARNATIRFVYVFAMTARAHDDAKGDLLTWMRNGTLRHNVAAVYSLEEVVLAHETLERGSLVGKLVVQP